MQRMVDPWRDRALLQLQASQVDILQPSRQERKGELSDPKEIKMTITSRQTDGWTQFSLPGVRVQRTLSPVRGIRTKVLYNCQPCCKGESHEMEKAFREQNCALKPDSSVNSIVTESPTNFSPIEDA